jgi:hypothetical protein
MAWAGYYVHKYELVTTIFKSRNRGVDGILAQSLHPEPAMRERKLDFSTTKKTEENRKKQKIRDLRHLTFQVSVTRMLIYKIVWIYYI